jgi:hypothetical protein
MTNTSRNSNPSLWLGRLLFAGAILEGSVGVALLLNPSLVVTLLLHSPLQGPGVPIGRIAGAGLFGLGVACWHAHRSPHMEAQRDVSWALTAYNLIACAVLVLASPPLNHGGVLAVGTSTLHGILGAGLIGLLLNQAGRSA